MTEVTSLIESEIQQLVGLLTSPTLRSCTVTAGTMRFLLTRGQSHRDTAEAVLNQEYGPSKHPADPGRDFTVTFLTAPRGMRIMAIAQALADTEATAEATAYARGLADGAERERAPCSCHSCEVLPKLHEQVAQMCEYLGSKREEVPCDSWHLRDLITKFKAETAKLQESYRTQTLALTKVIHERESARRDLEALNNAAADLVAEAVGPYDPPQRGSNLEKLYRLTQAPMGWKKAGESE